MKKQITFAIAAMLMLASCSEKMANDDAAQSAVAGGVSFKTFVDNNTKGLPYEGKELKQDFGVFAYTDVKRTHNRPALVCDFMYMQEVDYNTSGPNKGDFTYSPLKFWPEEGCVDFYAYTPYTSDNENWIPKLFGIGVPYLYYTVSPTNIECHEDLMVAEALDQDGDKPCVNFNFKHALTKVGVVAHLDSDCAGVVVKITDLKFEDLYYKGTFNYDRFNLDCKLWWVLNILDRTDYDLEIEPDGCMLVYSQNADWHSHKRVHTENNYLLAMPQTLLSSAKLCVTYEVIEGAKKVCHTKTVKLSDCYETWKPGECIIYDLCISVETIGFTAHVEDWDDCITVIKEIESGC